MITLATLDQATAQEVFTQVKDHLLKQGERSLSPTGVWSTHKSLLAAKTEAAHLQAFYDKYPFDPLGDSQ